jgi:hypothetical protein
MAHVSKGCSTHTTSAMGPLARLREVGYLPLEHANLPRLGPRPNHPVGGTSAVRTLVSDANESCAE